MYRSLTTPRLNASRSAFFVRLGINKCSMKLAVAVRVTSHFQQRHHRHRPIPCYTKAINFNPSLRFMAMHIYRIDHKKSHTHSWFVTIQRRGRVYHRHFTDSVYGGKSKALDAANVYRDSLMNCLRPLTRPERCMIKKKNNRSGISGVTRIDIMETSRGRHYHRRYWLAQWPIGNGKARKKKFSIMRYGERGAFQRALQARRRAIRALAPKVI